MTVDHEKLRREHSFNKFGRPSFTEDEGRLLATMYVGNVTSELLSVADHRFAEREGRGAIIHQPSPYHPCPLCRAMAMEEVVKVAAESDYHASEWEEWVSELQHMAAIALGSQVDTPAAEGSES